MRFLCPLVLVLAGAFPSTAGAQAPGDAPADNTVATPAHTKSTTTWYGWQIALADLTALGLAVKTETSELLLAEYLFGGLVIHAAHGEQRKALASVGLRVGVPVVGFLLGAAQGSCNDEEDFDCGLGAMVAGTVIGMGTAAVLDWFWLANKTRRVEGRTALLRTHGIEANPTLAVQRDGARIGLAGTF